MSRVFLDANVLFSAAYLEASGLRALWKVPKAVILTSTLAVEEARRNLPEPAQQARLDALLKRTTIEPTTMQTGAAQRDGHGLPEKDRPILWAAIDLKATHLINGDRTHFGRLHGKSVEGVRILTPREFLDERRSRSDGND